MVIDTMPRPTVILTAYPEPVTENVGEYRSVTIALNYALKHKLDDVQFLTDSRLVVEQVAGRSRVKAGHLRPLRDNVRDLLAQGRDYKLGWVPREFNLAGKVLE